VRWIRVSLVLSFGSAVMESVVVRGRSGDEGPSKRTYSHPIIAGPSAIVNLRNDQSRNPLIPSSEAAGSRQQLGPV